MPVSAPQREPETRCRADARGPGARRRDSTIGRWHSPSRLALSALPAFQAARMEAQRRQDTQPAGAALAAEPRAGGLRPPVATAGLCWQVPGFSDGDVPVPTPTPTRLSDPLLRGTWSPQRPAPRGPAIRECGSWVTPPRRSPGPRDSPQATVITWERAPPGREGTRLWGQENSAGRRRGRLLGFPVGLGEELPTPGHAQEWP